MLRSLLAIAALLSAMFSTPVFAMSGAEVLKMVNHDNDQTLEMSEAIKAAAGVFQHLSKDGSLTVDRSETAGRVSEADWTAVNKDHDQTLELDEWLSMARMRFTAADANHTGKLGSKELDTPAGQQLVKMIVQ